MRIKDISLNWFRGAAEWVTLATECKSVVVYGTNGSGKSSFADAVELILNKGRISHLAHEYSGRYQEKALPNAQTPEGSRASVEICLEDGAKVESEPDPAGHWVSSGAAKKELDGWDYRRTILRQDEVVNFIRATKGEKYSALLPLLGLGRLENAAANLHNLLEEWRGERRSRSREIAFGRCV